MLAIEDKINAIYEEIKLSKPEELLSPKDIMALLKVGHNKFYELLKNDSSFPKRVILDPTVPRTRGTASRWRASEIKKWLDSLPSLEE